MSARVELAWRTVRWPFAAGAFGAGTSARDERVAVLVEARGADGAIGLGEAAPLPGRSPDAVADVVSAIRALAPLTVRGPDDIAALPITPPSARFAIEVALLGVLAARAERDLASLLRGDAAPAALATAIVVATPDDAARAVAAGARTLKLKVGGDGDEPARVAAIAAAAPGARLRLDANQAWPRDEVAPRLAALRALPCADAIEFVEEPCAGVAELVGAPLPLPIALDESLAGLAPAAVTALLAWPAVRALVLKPTILGGALAAQALAAQAARAGRAAILSHALEGPIGTAACCELARALAPDGAAVAGVGAHPALAGWRLVPPQLAGAAVRRAAGPGLGFGALDLASAARAAPHGDT